MYKASEQIPAGIIFTSQEALIHGLLPSLNTVALQGPKPRDKFVWFSTMYHNINFLLEKYSHV